MMKVSSDDGDEGKRDELGSSVEDSSEMYGGLYAKNERTDNSLLVIHRPNL